MVQTIPARFLLALKFREGAQCTLNLHHHTIKTNCKFCGKLFDSFKLSKVCPSCEANMEDYFKQIKSYLETHPDATTEEICAALGLTLPIITHFLKEERLSIKKTSKKLVLTCDICQKPITSGRYCFECSVNAARSELRAGIEKSGADESRRKNVPRFHTLSEGSKS